MFQLIAQTTQSTMWTPDAVERILTYLVAAVIPAIIALIYAIKAKGESAEAKSTSQANAQQIQNLHDDKRAVDDRITQVALQVPTTPTKEVSMQGSTGVGVDAGVGSRSNVQHPPVGLWLAIGVGMIMLLLSASGCGTSAAFKQAIKPGVDNAVQDLNDIYLPNDKQSDAPTLADRKAKTDALSVAVSDPKMITLEGVSSAWEQVDPFYRAYIDADKSLDPESRSIRIATPNQIDSLIKKERARQDSFFNRLIPPASP